MSFINRVGAYLNTARNLSGTDVNLVSQFGFGPETLCFTEGKISKKITDYLDAQGVRITRDLPVNESVKNALKDNKTVIIVTEGKSIDQIKMEGAKIYIPYPNPGNVVQVFEHESIPGEDELRNPVLHKKALPKRGTKLIVMGEAPDIKSIKFNDQRREDFHINTILTDGSVIKMAGNKASQDHLNAILINRNKLTRMNPKADLACCEKVSDDRLKMEFVNGRSLLEDTNISEDPIEKITEDLSNAIDTILEYKTETIKFDETEAFRKMFSGIHPSNNEDCYPVINIDSNFDNFLRTEDRIVCIDYEWVADFPLPIRYVKLRALHFFYLNNRTKLARRISHEDFLRRFGFTDEDIKLFMDMEYSFQAFIAG